MVTEGGRIDFMFLTPPPLPAAGTATVVMRINLKYIFEVFLVAFMALFSSKTNEEVTPQWRI